MLVLSHDELIGLLPPPQIVAAVEATLRAQDAGRVVSPQRLHLQWEVNTLLAVPAAAAEGGVGVKIISVVPGNAARGLSVTDGVMLLNDSETCRRCGGRLLVTASIEDPAVIERILNHLGPSAESPDPAHLTRAPPQRERSI